VIVLDEDSVQDLFTEVREFCRLLTGASQISRFETAARAKDYTRALKHRTKGSADIMIAPVSTADLRIRQLKSNSQGTTRSLMMPAVDLATTLP